VEKQAAHIADYWRSVRVGLTQAAPGRLIVRALRTDPLAESFGPGRCPPGIYEPHQPTVLYVGRDDFGRDRYLPLRGLTGSRAIHSSASLRWQRGRQPGPVMPWSGEIAS
jgi:DNA segregation ATPase FtsK/SpoIIIE, S-DNA-T family